MPLSVQVMGANQLSDSESEEEDEDEDEDEEEEEEDEGSLMGGMFAE